MTAIFAWLMLLLVQRPPELFIAQADVWEFAFTPAFKPPIPAHSKHIFYLVSDPRTDVMGRIYFRSGAPLLFRHNPTLFRSADEAYSAGIAEGFIIRRK